MSNLGLGAMIGMLSGDKDLMRAIEHAKSQRLAGAFVADDRINLVLADGSTVLFWDGGQSCCEDRHLTCDDDLGTFVGAQIVDITTRESRAADEPGFDADNSYDEHDLLFVKIETDLGHITLCNHNIHNGYYGGFCLCGTIVD